jgi:hypothetical protein
MIPSAGRMSVRFEAIAASDIGELEQVEEVRPKWRGAV